MKIKSKIEKKIKAYRRELDNMFGDPFLVKQDNANQIVTRYRWRINRVNRKLWFK